MKIIKETQEVIKGYEAIDGERFSTKEACEEYEHNAQLTLLKEIKPNIVKEMTQYDLWDDCSDELGVWVITVPTEDFRMKLNTYITMKTGNNMDNNIVKQEMIGKTICLFWSYDHDYCWTYGDGTIDGVLAFIKECYEKNINPPQTEQK